MKNTVKDITLYCYRHNSESDREHCTRHFLENVSSHGSLTVNVSKDGFASADVFTIRIPEELGSFDIREGDMVVLGQVEENAPSRADLIRCYGALTVVSCTDNCGKHGGHWKVICK